MQSNSQEDRHITAMIFFVYFLTIVDSLPNFINTKTQISSSSIYIPSQINKQTYLKNTNKTNQYIKKIRKSQMNYQQFLKDLDQTHILEAYLKASAQNKKALEEQIDKLNITYPGGLQSYYERALQLLKDSAESVNPYEDYQVGKPNGINFHFDKPDEIEHFETIGLKEFNHTAFVLVAGGLGERLGYPGIKLLTRRRFMHYYIDYILAYQQKFCDKGVKIPLAIMTSDDTHEQTIELLEKNNYFGMEKEQITIMKQEKVPAMLDNSAHFALLKEQLLIDTKPHGHGDVHTLLYQHKLIENWHKEGKKWVIFFQDTNPLVFRSYPMLLGVSRQKDFDFNSIATPRKPGEAVGAITTLVNKKDENKKLIINVQYNMLEGLFKQIGGQPKDPQGYSLYPGNINSFAIKISSYNDALNNTKGHISQFINPKYADQTKTTFKSSARLQCLMQDYPKLLPNCDKVGFTDIPKGLCFSTVKNDLKTAVDKVKKGLSGESASTCQAEFYYYNRVLLRMCGAQIQQCQPVQAGDIKLPLFPMIYLSPHFATCYTQLKNKVKKLKVTAKSSLSITSDCILQDVDVDGDDEIIEDGSICLKVDDQNYKQLVPLQGDEQPYLLIRGYDLSD